MQSYFELFDMKPTLQPDRAAVKRKFYELSKAFHPDRFVHAEEHERTQALQKAALVNDAYKTLNNEDLTLAYVLREAGVLETEEGYKLPPEFLMEMMDLNEAVSDATAETADETLKAAALNAWNAQLDELKLSAVAAEKRFEIAPEDHENLLRLKDFYFRKKYLLRIKERLTTFASR